MKNNTVSLLDVGPRDGLQNENIHLNTETIFEYISKIEEAGIQEIEAGSFVRNDRVPAMKNTAEVFNLLNSRNKTKKNGPKYFALIPNVQGLKEAEKYQVKHMAVFTATSELFNLKNINASIDQSMEKIKNIVDAAKSNNNAPVFRAYISTVFGCPYDKQFNLTKSIEKTNHLINTFQSIGINDFSLGDTIGIAHPRDVKEVIKNLDINININNRIAMHFHNTKGMAVANVLTAYELGITHFDSSCGGIGGCPYAPGAAGNVATEELVYLFQGLGVQTGVDYEKIKIASNFIRQKLQRPGHVY